MFPDELEGLKTLVEDYIGEFLSTKNALYNVLAVFLYGSAAKYYVGQKDSHNDFDLNVFFRESDTRDSSISTYGKPKVIGRYMGKKVEVMRNVYCGSAGSGIEAVKEYAGASSSKRWKRITSEPLIFLSPTFQIFDRLL